MLQELTQGYYKLSDYKQIIMIEGISDEIVYNAMY